MTTVDYFPNLRTHQLKLLVQEIEEAPVPTLSRPLRGRIHVGQVDYLQFFNRFAQLDLEYEELVIDPDFIFLEIPFLNSAIQISASTVKFLRLAATPKREFNCAPRQDHILTPLPHAQVDAGPTLHSFRRLQELELVFGSSEFSYRTLLSSITSIELRKIVLRVMYALNEWTSQRSMQGLDLVDKELCQLVDRLRAVGYRRTLEVELRFARIAIDPGKDGCVKFLPRFEEKGVVTIAGNVRGGQVFYSSALNR